MSRLLDDKRPIAVAASVIIIMGLLCYVWLFRQPAPSTEKKLRIGYLPIAASLPLFVSIDQGYFQNEGFEVELIQFGSSNEMAVAGAKNNLDIMVTCATNAVLDVIDISGANIKAFMANGYVKGTNNTKPTDYLLALPGESFSSLKGQNIAFFPGSVSRVFAAIVLPKYGLTIDTIKYVEMAPGTWLAALKSGQVKAVVAVEPFATIIMESDVAVPLIEGYIAQIFDGVPLSGAWFAGDRISSKDKEEIANIFAKAITAINTDREQSLRTLEVYTKLSSAVYMKMGLNRWGLTTDPQVRNSFYRFAQILYENKAIRSLPKDNDWLWTAKKLN